MHSYDSPNICESDERLRKFLDQEFDGQPGLLDEFPLLVGSVNRARRLILEGRPGIVAHAAWRPLTLRIGDRRLRAAGIGLVTTRRSERGRGYASHLVEACLAQASASGADLALLFSSARSLYTDLGFVAAGRERVSAPEWTPPGPTLKGELRRARAQDVPELLRLLEAHPLRVERSAGEFEALLSVRGVHGYVLEREDRCVAYCLEGKGRDLRGVAHEWAGAPEPVADLLTAMAGIVPGGLTVLSPAAWPAPIDGRSFLQPIAQVRILRPERFGSADPVRIFGDANTSPEIPFYVWGLDSV